MLQTIWSSKGWNTKPHRCFLTDKRDKKKDGSLKRTKKEPTAGPSKDAEDDEPTTYPSKIAKNDIPDTDDGIPDVDSDSGKKIIKQIRVSEIS